VNVLVARKAIEAVGKIALRVAARANTCADKLVSLLAMEIDYVTAETLISLASELIIKYRISSIRRRPRIDAALE
jgi:hypothetical protein